MSALSPARQCGRTRSLVEAPGWVTAGNEPVARAVEGRVRSATLFRLSALADNY